MACDIYTFAEIQDKNTKKWSKVTNHFSINYLDNKKEDGPFNWRSYPMFALLAGVRCYYNCRPISYPKGLPKDISEGVKKEYDEHNDVYSESFLTLRELLRFNYDKLSYYVNDEDKKITYRELLGEMFFTNLEELKSLGDPDSVRIVFWFDI